MFTRGKTLRIASICLICQQYHRNPYPICQECSALLESLGPACRHCAIPLPQPTPPVCGSCSITSPDLDRVFTAYRFTEPLRTLVHSFKYNAALYLSSFLCQLMLEAKDPENATECLIPIPLHAKRLQTRGFNQAAVLAKHLSKIIQKPYAAQDCAKMIPTLPQAGLNAKQRRTNLKDAFAVKPLPYRHVTLVDDLFTTGATANSVAKILKEQAGVQRVDLWCCARVC